MKKIMTVTEVDGEGLVGLLGEKVILFCMNYFYAGTLSGVNDDCVLLEDGGITFGWAAEELEAALAAPVQAEGEKK